jgi:hypothetical protein
MDDQTYADGDGQPLFLDEPVDLPKPGRVETDGIEALFHDEDAPSLPPQSSSGWVDWQELNALSPQASAKNRIALMLDRSSIVIVLIVAAAVLGFAMTRALLN